MQAGIRPTLFVAVMLLSGCAGRRANRRPQENIVPASSSTVPVSTSMTAVIPTTTEVLPTRTLFPGDAGADVAALQQRLIGLHYWLGEADGSFGPTTKQAVFAFQKVNHLDVDGRVGPQVRQAMEQPVAPPARSSTGLVWEVDRTAQIVMVVRDGSVAWIWNTSTGTNEPYTHDGRQHIADTPAGHFTFDWQVDDWRDGALGRLYRPKYFHPDGIALHGYHRVPPYPASHGCVRVSLPAMDFIWAKELAPIGTSIWVY